MISFRSRYRPVTIPLTLNHYENQRTLRLPKRPTLLYNSLWFCLTVTDIR